MFSYKAHYVMFCR